MYGMLDGGEILKKTRQEATERKEIDTLFLEVLSSFHKHALFRYVDGT